MSLRGALWNCIWAGRRSRRKKSPAAAVHGDRDQDPGSERRPAGAGRAAGCVIAEAGRETARAAETGGRRAAPFCRPPAGLDAGESEKLQPGGGGPGRGSKHAAGCSPRQAPAERKDAGSDPNFSVCSWDRMTPEERADADKHGRWTDGRCSRCLYHDPAAQACSFYRCTGHRRRKPERYSGRCPEFAAKSRRKKTVSDLDTGRE